MENLHTLAKTGTLTRSKLTSYLARQDIDDQDDYGETPLFLAIRGGHVGSVKLLLQSGADVNEKATDGKTSLYMATQAPANNASIIKLLLKHKAKADSPIPELGNDAPIMEAVRQGKSPEAIRLLIDHGASLTNRNLSGQSAQSLADKSTNTAIHRALRPKNEQPGWKHELENLLVSSALFGLAYFGNWKDIGRNAIRRVAALSVPQAKV
jgi:ankyrin repeat protein